jgi:Mg2+-importing ATPase
VIVKRLSAIEDAGNIEVVCADKTGTLTENKLRVHEVFAEHPEQALFLAAAAIPQENLLKLSHADPFDRALFDRLGEREKKEISRLKKLWERPFNPVERSNASVVLLSGRPVLIVRGAPEAILKKSFGFNKQSVEEFYKKEGIAGRRVIALAYKELCSNYQKVQKTSGLENRLCFAGLISFEDQIKTSAYKAVEEAKKLGIEIKILTGDSPEVAKYVAEKLNLLQGRVFSGFELQKMSQREFEKTILSNSVFARVSPQQKLKIVELLVKKKSTAFLGEGINDAPSLEAANVAMVVQSGADISKEAGDIILTKKDLTAVVLAVKEGRRVFINISKYLRYTLIANFGNFFSMAVISLIVPFLPMLAVQILLVNLLSDLPHLAVATDNVDFEEVARPVKYDFRNIGISVLALGLINSVFDFILLAIFFAAPLTRLRSLWFFENALTELLVFFSLRTKKFFLTAAPPSRLVTLGHLVVAVLILLIPFMPGANLFHLEAPSLTQWGIILLLVFAYVISSESAKLLFFKHFK